MVTKLALPIVAKNIDSAIRQIKKAEQDADIIEFRADFIRDLTSEGILKVKNHTNAPLIFTCRPEYEGGHFNGNEDKRFDFLQYAIEIGYEYLDVEYKSTLYDNVIENPGDTKIILSYHDFSTTPAYSRLESLVVEMQNACPAFIKLITTAKSINDNFKIFKILRNHKQQNLIAFCMGIYGEISRVLCKKYGSFLSFASLAKGQESADGQIQINEMLTTYNFDRIDSRTQITGVAGKYAENSKSKYLHNPVFRKSNQNFIYLPLKIEPGRDLKNFIANFKDFDFKGLAVTIPHKEKIIKYLDKLNNKAKEIAAVNTVVNRSGSLFGYNTDFIGAITALEAKGSVENQSCLVIGAGGAARAVVYGLTQKAAKVTITNRTNKRAQKLADEFDCDYIKFAQREQKSKNFDIIINTTSVGMYPNDDKTVLENFEAGTLVMDIVYKPLMTKFLKLAKNAGCQIVTGEKMLVYQAMEQFKLWTGKRPKFEDMHAAFFEIP